MSPEGRPSQPQLIDLSSYGPVDFNVNHYPHRSYRELFVPQQPCDFYVPDKKLYALSTHLKLACPQHSRRRGYDMLHVVFTSDRDLFPEAERKYMRQLMERVQNATGCTLGWSKTYRTMTYRINIGDMIKQRLDAAVETYAAAHHQKAGDVDETTRQQLKTVLGIHVAQDLTHAMREAIAQQGKMQEKPAQGRFAISSSTEEDPQGPDEPSPNGGKLLQHLKTRPKDTTCRIR